MVEAVLIKILEHTIALSVDGFDQIVLAWHLLRRIVDGTVFIQRWLVRTLRDFRLLFVIQVVNQAHERFAILGVFCV